MTNINMFNNIYTHGVSNSDSIGVNPAAQTRTGQSTGPEAAGTSGAGTAYASQSPSTASIAASGADELMQQLIDDANAVGRTPTATVLQALKAAGLAENAKNINIVNSLIENNMPIGREALRSFVLQTRAYSNADIDTLIALNRSDIPVTEESVNTVQEFMHNGLIMTSDVNELADMVESLLSDPSTPQELADSIRQAVFETVYGAVQENAGANAEEALNGAQSAVNGMQNANEAVAQSSTVNAGAQQAAATPGALGASGAALAGMAAPVRDNPGSPLAYRIVNETATNNATEDATAGPGGGNAGYGLSGSLAGMEESEGDQVADQTASAGAGRAESRANPLAGSDAGIPSAIDNANEEIMSFRIHEDISGRNDYTFRDFDDLARALANQADEEAGIPANSSAAAEELARSEAEIPGMPEAFRKLSASEVKGLLKNALSLNPEKLSKNSIKALYERTSDFFNKVKEATEESSGQSALHAKAEQAARDTSLLNALNRMYPHIELPLKLANENAEGGLYVYTNRNGHTGADGHVTALLHLNMPNLGVVDIHLDLKDTYLGMNYYCEDDAGQLLAGDITSLRGDLEKMGYSVLARFNPAGSAAESVEAALKADRAGSDQKDPADRLSFDKRA